MSERDPLDDLPWPKPIEPGATVSESIHRQCTHALGKTKCARAHRRAALSLLIPTLAIGLFAFLALLRGDPSEMLEAALYGVFGWVVVMAVVLSAGLAFPPGRRPARALRLVAAVAVPVLFMLYVTTTASAHDSFAMFAEGAKRAHAVRCGVSCLLLGAVVTGAVLYLWRGTDPFTPGVSGALAGLIGGLGSALAFGVACPSHEAWHVGTAHGLVVVAMVAAGALVGRRLLAP
jgi:hypothetical protein